MVGRSASFDSRQGWDISSSPLHEDKLCTVNVIRLWNPGGKKDREYSSRFESLVQKSKISVHNYSNILYCLNILGLISCQIKTFILNSGL
jgi:hypothetical protein